MQFLEDNSTKTKNFYLSLIKILNNTSLIYKKIKKIFR